MHCLLLTYCVLQWRDRAVLAVIGDSNAATSVAGFSRSLELYSLN